MKINLLQHRIGHGWSTENWPDSNSDKTLVIAFGSPAYRDHKKPLEELNRHYAKSLVLGCSTAGEIFDTRIFDESLSVAVVEFEKTKLKKSYARLKSADDSFNVGRALALELSANDLKSIFILSDGTNVNGSQLLKGLNSVLPKEVVVTGGLAGDGARMKQTWVLENGNPQENIVCALGFYGKSVQVAHGSLGGWDIFGPQRRVTKSQNNVLYELDGKPALELYKLYLGDRAKELPSAALLFPLSMKTDDSEKSLVRTILAVDDKTNSMTFAGDIPQGAIVQLMRANFDRLIDGAAGAAEITKKAISAKPKPSLTIAISCVGRRLVLGERTEEETEATKKNLPSNTQQIGFYSYGEISPYASGHCDLHNQTMTLTTITEE